MVQVFFSFEVLLKTKEEKKGRTSSEIYTKIYTENKREREVTATGVTNFDWYWKSVGSWMGTTTFSFLFKLLRAYYFLIATKWSLT